MYSALHRDRYFSFSIVLHVVLAVYYMFLFVNQVPRIKENF